MGSVNCNSFSGEKLKEIKKIISELENFSQTGIDRYRDDRVSFELASARDCLIRALDEVTRGDKNIKVCESCGNHFVAEKKESFCFGCTHPRKSASQGNGRHLL